MQKIGGGVLYKYLQSVQAYIAPPITTVFLLGILWKRVNAQGAIATLFFGLFMGAARIIAELQYSVDGSIVEGGSGLWYQYASINFSHMAIFMFIACVMVCITVSLMTAAPSAEKVQGLTLGSLTPEQKAANRNSYTILDIVASLVLVAIIIGILAYFTG